MTDRIKPATDEDIKRFSGHTTADEDLKHWLGRDEDLDDYVKSLIARIEQDRKRIAELEAVAKIEIRNGDSFTITRQVTLHKPRMSR